MIVEHPLSPQLGDRVPRTGPFDKHAPAYDEWFERNQLAYQSELDAVRTLLPEWSRAVEVGVGTRDWPRD